MQIRRKEHFEDESLRNAPLTTTEVPDWDTMESVMEGTNIHATTIYPGAVKTELLNTIAPSETKTMVENFYAEAGLTPDIIANAVLYALSQPDHVNVSDLVIRPSLES